MEKFYFTPGPSQLYYTVDTHLKHALSEQIPSISHRSKGFEAIYSEAETNIRALLGLPDDYHVFFTASATEVWERLIQNLVQHESFHFVNGAFSSRFQKVAEQLGISARHHTVAEGQVVDINKVLIPETAELIALTQNETSTGASQPVDDIYKIREAFPNQLIAIDVVSAAPVVDLDYSKVDTAYFSVQKCFGLPAGLGVWIVNDRCMTKCQQLMDKGHAIGSYHSIPEFLKKAEKNQTPETPNVLNLYLLAKVAGDMLTKGVDQIRRESTYKSAVLYQAFEESEYVEAFVTTHTHRSLTTLVAKTSVPSAQIIEAYAKKGIIIGSGYGKSKDEHIRIANFPTHSKEHIEMIADMMVQLKF